MANPLFINDDNFEGDVLREAIRSYKEAMRAPTQDLDIEFLVKTLRIVNEASPVKVARNPLTADHEWNPETTLYDVRGIEVDEQNRLCVTIRKDKQEYPVERFLIQLGKLMKMLPDKKAPVMLMISEQKTVQITDVYSHAFMSDAYSGLPLHLVLGYYEED